MTTRKVGFLFATGVVFALCGLKNIAIAQSLRLQVESNELYANVPFELSAIAKGFEEDPAPTISKLTIAGCKVTPLGASPHVSSSIQVVNGRMTQSREVTYVFRFRVEAQKPGTFQVPALTASQGGASAQSRAASFRVRDISTTTDLKLRLTVPSRAVWVGEVFEVSLDLYLRRDPQDTNFVVPLFDQEEWVEVLTPEVKDKRRTFTFFAGSRKLELPYQSQKDVLEGREYTRFRFSAQIRPKRAGTLSLPPAKVIAGLQVGMTRDRIGFPTARVRRFKAEDTAKTIEVRAPPMQGRPASFAGAVGSGYSIAVQAGRSVVRLGEPIELTIKIRGDGDMSGLTLPALDADGGLSKTLFTIPDETPLGEIVGDEKHFKVVVRPKSPKVRTIPAIAFSYFDPKLSKYKTERSQVIALAVQGSAIVGSDQVTGSGGHTTTDKTAPKTNGQPAVSNFGERADLALSAPTATMQGVLSTAKLRPILLALYILPLLILLFRVWQVRTREQRELSSEVKHKLTAVLKAAAAQGPARDVAPRIAAALRALARYVGASLDGPDGQLLERLDTEAYDPKSADSSLSSDLTRSCVELAKQLATQDKRPATKGAAASAVILALLGLAAPAHAEVTLEEARTAYRNAQTAGTNAVQQFERAEAMFRALTSQNPNRPQLLTDWGNAALASQKPGYAVLAYRRALALDKGNERAQKNLALLREQRPDWTIPANDASAIDTLFFWHHRLSTPMRHLIAAGCFAIIVLLWAPWGRRKRPLRALSIIPAVVFVAMIASVVLESDQADEVVVVANGVILRSADSVGAPPAEKAPLPAGAEAQLRERRPDWLKLEFSNGATGWVPETTTKFVTVSR